MPSIYGNDIPTGKPDIQNSGASILPETLRYMSFFGGSAVKNLTASTGDPGLIPGLGRFPREENGNPL